MVLSYPSEPALAHFSESRAGRFNVAASLRPIQGAEDPLPVEGGAGVQLQSVQMIMAENSPKGGGLIVIQERCSRLTVVGERNSRLDSG